MGSPAYVGGAMVWPDFSLPALLNVVSYLTGVKKSGQEIFSVISVNSSDPEPGRRGAGE